MQRFLLLAACLIGLPCCSGCVIPYVFPKVAFTRSLQLAAATDEVHVFRVDRRQITAPYPFFARERLSAVAVANNGKVAPQFKASIRNGVYMFMVALNYDFGQGKYLSLRAYRPGFELIEIESAGQMEWIPAKDWAAEERAVDLLLPDRDQESDVSYLQQEVGSCSAAHREALLFGAAEYDRLAFIAENPDDQMRCQRKASTLRKRALE